LGVRADEKYNVCHKEDRAVSRTDNESISIDVLDRLRYKQLRSIDSRAGKMKP
jgi:hypothetical protein